VVIGTLLPWFDGFWEEKFGAGAGVGGRRMKLRRKSNEDERRPPMDLSLVLRAVSAFLGIVFAIVSPSPHLPLPLSTRN
jgi:polyferredoxin